MTVSSCCTVMSGGKGELPRNMSPTVARRLESARNPLAIIQLSLKIFDMYPRPDSGRISRPRIASGESVFANLQTRPRRWRCPTISTDEQAFLARDPARHEKRIAIGDAYLYLVDLRADHRLAEGNSFLNPFDRIRRGMSPSRSSLRGRRRRLNRRIFLLEIARRARNGPAGADSGDECVISPRAPLQISGPVV